MVVDILLELLNLFVMFINKSCHIYLVTYTVHTNRTIIYNVWKLSERMLSNILLPGCFLLEDVRSKSWSHDRLSEYYTTDLFLRYLPHRYITDLSSLRGSWGILFFSTGSGYLLILLFLFIPEKSSTKMVIMLILLHHICSEWPVLCLHQWWALIVSHFLGQCPAIAQLRRKFFRDHYLSVNNW